MGSCLSRLYAYQRMKERARVERRAAESEAVLARPYQPTDPCALCNVRPEFHDEFGCKHYTMTRR